MSENSIRDRRRCAHKPQQCHSSNSCAVNVIDETTSEAEALTRVVIQSHKYHGLSCVTYKAAAKQVDLPPLPQLAQSQLVPCIGAAVPAPVSVASAVAIEPELHVAALASPLNVPAVSTEMACCVCPVQDLQLMSGLCIAFLACLKQQVCLSVLVLCVEQSVAKQGCSNVTF